jgi:hypothetical protein
MVKEEGSIQEEEDPPSPLILPAGLHQDSTVRAESVSLSPSPENSPAQGPTRQFCPLSPLWLHPRSPCSLGPITCNELIHPILSFGRISDQLLHETSALQDSLRFNSTATQKRVPLGAKTPTKMGSSSNGPSPDKTTPPERTPKSLRYAKRLCLDYFFFSRQETQTHARLRSAHLCVRECVCASLRVRYRLLTTLSMCLCSLQHDDG